MNVIAKFVHDKKERMTVELLCAATRTLKAVIPHQPESRRSMTWITEHYATLHGHTITAWDRCALTNGEHEEVAA